jgi:addiction module RelE/StbE family toxin
MRIVWSPRALDRVAEIAGYIRGERPQAAERWVEKTFAAVKRLRDYPLSGCVVSELGRQDVREIVSGAYRIVYRVEASQLSVLTVRHSRQLMEENGVGDPEVPGSAEL